MSVVLRPVKPRDLRRVAADMRAQDRIEVGAFGRDPMTALRLAVSASSWSATAVTGSGPMAVMGVTPITLQHGRPWMLCAAGAMRERRAWADLAPKVVEAMVGEYPALSNYVAASNGPSSRWLRFLGFTVDAETTMVRGVAFRRFWRGDLLHMA